MSAEEALYRLSAIARGDMDNFISADGWLDLEKARELGLTPLIHELTADRQTGGEGALPRAAKRPARRPVAAPAPAGPANPSEDGLFGSDPPRRPDGGPSSTDLTIAHALNRQLDSLRAGVGHCTRILTPTPEQAELCRGISERLAVRRCAKLTVDMQSHACVS